MTVHEILGLVESYSIKVNIQILGNKDVEINMLGLLGKEYEHNKVLSYINKKKYIKRINDKICAIIINYELFELFKDFGDEMHCVIVTDNPERLFYDIHECLVVNTDFYFQSEAVDYIDYTACIHKTAIIEDNVFIGKNVTIDAYSIIKRGTYIDDGCKIGCHSIIGAEGFQVLRIDGINRKISHCGGVKLSKNVEIGNFVTVCKTLFDGYTYIGENTKIDNYCEISHYVNIGKNVIIPPGVILVGGVTIKDGAYIGAGATIMNRVTIEKDSTVGIGSVVFDDVYENETVIGNPAVCVWKNS